METHLFWIVPLSSIVALALAWFFYHQMKKEDEGTPTMKKIALYVRQGAMSYLKQQYKVVTMVFVGLVILFSIMAYGFNLQNHWVPVAFLTGGFFSGLLRSCRIFGNEDRYLCFGTYGQRGTHVAQQGLARGVPKWCRDGTCRCRSWPVRHFFLVSVA